MNMESSDREIEVPDIEQSNSLNAQNLSSVSDDQVSMADKKPAPIHAQPPRTSAPFSKGLLESFILDALAFSSMTDRQDEVAQAHSKTFEWIFHDVSTADTKSGATKAGANFLQWLREKSGDDGGVYWINGKAGSGKSTLLRYIYDHQKTKQELGIWAEPKPLTMARFFFWTSGSLEQRSQVGLLRSLLSQLLEQHRELISVTFPVIWETYRAMSTKERIKLPISWSLTDLTYGLKLFLRNAVHQTKICLFIDGLDEFDGDHGEIVTFFKNIVNSANPDLKICLSSRPWAVFEQSFTSVPSLKLQDLTREDRQKYVVGTFIKDVRMRRIVRKEPKESDALMDEIVMRADGVFLWVILVVRFLLGSLSTGDRISDIAHRLQELPTDLDEFFNHTLFKIQDKQAICQASKIFQLIRAREVTCEFTGDYSSSSLIVWELALADLNEMVLKASIHQVSDNEVLSLCNSMTDRIETCCAGLLGIHVKPNKKSRAAITFAGEGEVNDINSLVQSKVTFLHRTIRDWLFYSPTVWDNILRYTEELEYNPHISHVESYILQLKLPLEEPEHHRRLDEWWPGVVLSLTHARYAGPELATQVELIDELDKTISWYWLKKESQEDDHWAKHTFGSYEERNKNIISHPFLSLATKFGLTEYVSAKLRTINGSELGLGYHGGRPLLSYSTDFLINRKKTVFPLSDLRLVENLLEYGCDPNLVYSDFSGKEETPWLSSLKLVREALRRKWISEVDEDILRWTDILQKLLDYRADVNAVIKATSWDPEITPLGIIDGVLEEFDNEAVRGLRESTFSKGAH